MCSLLGSGVMWTIDGSPGTGLVLQGLSHCIHLSRKSTCLPYANGNQSYPQWTHKNDLHTSTFLWKLLTLMATFDYVCAISQMYLPSSETLLCFGNLWLYFCLAGLPTFECRNIKKLTCTTFGICLKVVS